jgi:hypothetical protein
MSGARTHRVRGSVAWRATVYLAVAAAAPALGACVSPEGVPLDASSTDGAPSDASSPDDGSLASDQPPSPGDTPAPGADDALVRCSGEIIGSPDAPPLPPVRGAFRFEPGFDEALGPRQRGEPLMTVVASTVIPIYVDGDRVPDTYTSFFARPSEATATIVANDGDGGWERRPDFPLPGPCYVQADLVGDEAWDLLCQGLLGELTVYEGQLTPDGAALDLALGPAHPVVPVRRNGHPADIALSSVQSARIQDVNGDGLDDLLVPVFREGFDDWLLLQRPGWTWEAIPFHRGFSFATCALDTDGDYAGDLIFVYEEGGEAPSRDRTNALFAWAADTEGLVRQDVPRAGDPTGWFGVPTLVDPIAQSPMACAQRTLSFVGRPSYWLSQDDDASVEVLGVPGGWLCDLRSDALAPSRHRHHWAALAAGFRGVGEDLVIATDLDGPMIYSADRGCDELGCRTEISDPATGAPEQQLGDLAALRGVGPLAIHDMDGDAWPDLLVGFQDFAEPPRVLHNRLQRNPGQNVVCLELFGRNAAGARIDVDDGVDVHTVSVGNTGNPWLSPSPVAFVGVHGDDPVSVRVARDRGRRVDEYEVTPGACYWLFPGAPAVRRE